MIYLIDANNLAGSLGILRENDFDKLLIGIIKKWLPSRKNKIFLVFDSADPMGDKYSDGWLTIIYTPRDNYYNSADDKIIELVNNYLNSNKIFKPEDGELCVVTDDNGIKNKTKDLSKKYQCKIILMQASDLARQLNKIKNKDNHEENSGLRGLSQETINKINQDLLKNWR